MQIKTLVSAESPRPLTAAEQAHLRHVLNTRATRYINTINKQRDAK